MTARDNERSIQVVPNMLWFEDFPVGETVRFGDKEVTEDEIVAFARDFDPQPHHLDHDAGKDSILGGLSASGWHTCSMVMRMMCDAFMLETASLGSPGIAELKWVRPVRPGDRLHVIRTTRSARRSGSRPEMGIVEIGYDVRRQDDATVLTMEATHLFGCRPETEPSQ